MTTTVFRLPDVGEGLTEADILAWTVHPGDEIGVNDIIVEIETAKSVVELPSPTAGRVQQLLVEAGQTVTVGTPIIEFRTDGGADEPAPESAGQTASDSEAQPGSESESESSGATLVGYGTRASTSRRARRRAQRGADAPPAPAPVTETTAEAAPESPAATGLALAKPPVRKLAKDHGVDLTLVPPTGPVGNVTREDVLAYLEASSARDSAGQGATTAVGASPLGETRQIPVKGVRKATAHAMVASAFTAPHVTEFLDVDVTATVELIRVWKSQGVFPEGVKVSPLTLLSRAVCWAVGRTPEINASWGEEFITVHGHVNLGIAVNTDRGLLVPNIKNAHALTVTELARELTELSETARAGKATPECQRGGTITITNVGVFGVDAGTPIINPGESAIVAMGQIKRRPWVVDDELAVRDVATLSVSADHRVVDGVAISQFLADLGGALEDPRALLL
ncbi:dihydrolipoamide acetyltransferase family protein [Citricoccus muralis]|uniref:Dihydrolipoamide acetyltransferase component of pyruvate dehydrogenase complex n=1 Tax=Citricoccus muralis TaxID=169134 RepID=A0ABY8H8H4_9MICC|nr:dihydrolipoamide acetyltransferase family protein [Citricoccus muralis]WFP16953.1 dihydrolipoamide acetyltransferase family protein [Citricoccus muralis]